jgi:hypothetical protein
MHLLDSAPVTGTLCHCFRVWLCTVYLWLRSVSLENWKGSPSHDFHRKPFHWPAVEGHWNHSFTEYAECITLKFMERQLGWWAALLSDVITFLSEGTADRSTGLSALPVSCSICNYSRCATFAQTNKRFLHGLNWYCRCSKLSLLHAVLYFEPHNAEIS